jgi:hypothetical protein
VSAEVIDWIIDNTLKTGRTAPGRCAAHPEARRDPAIRGAHPRKPPADGEIDVYVEGGQLAYRPDVDAAAVLSGGRRSGGLESAWSRQPAYNIPKIRPVRPTGTSRRTRRPDIPSS